MVAGPATQPAPPQSQPADHVGREAGDREGLVQILDRLELRRHALGSVGGDQEPSERLPATTRAGVVASETGGAILGARLRLDRRRGARMQLPTPLP